MDLQAFYDSCVPSRYRTYPQSLAYGGSQNGALEAQGRLLSSISAYAFRNTSAVALLALEADPNAPQQLQEASTPLETDLDFDRWLVKPASATSQPADSNLRCRFFFIQAKSSEAKLDITSDHFCRLLTFFQVAPSLIDFISIFAIRAREPPDLRFSGFRDRISLHGGLTPLTRPVSYLGLSGRGYQLCYNLRSIANKTKENGDQDRLAREKWEWSARQMVAHHQFDVEKGTTLWILTMARTELQNRVRKLVGTTGRREDRDFTTPEKSFHASLAVHVLLAQAASEDWRGHVRWLEQLLEKRTDGAINHVDYVPTSIDLLYIQKKQDETNHAMMMLQGNMNILESLVTFYSDLMNNEPFIDSFTRKDDIKMAIADFQIQMKEYIYDFKMHIARAKTIGKTTADRKNLVQERLQENANMGVMELTVQSQREAIIMRVIAVITGIFLPATFVSTFFSTDVVKYQAVDGQGNMHESFSPLALQRWGAVTGVLTAITFLFAVAWIFGRNCLLYLRPRSQSKDLEKGTTVKVGSAMGRWGQGTRSK